MDIENTLNKILSTANTLADTTKNVKEAFSNDSNVSNLTNTSVSSPADVTVEPKQQETVKPKLKLNWSKIAFTSAGVVIGFLALVYIAKKK